MKVSLQWLREFIDLPIEDPDELEEVLASLGMPTDGIERLEAPFTGVVVARVDEIRAHPDADRLRLCRVTTPEGSSEVVCGAWNFEPGAIVPLAKPGAVLAGGLDVDMRTIRGVASEGMICSANELGLGEEAEGILVLDDHFSLGVDFADQLPFPDIVFDLEIESNRPDLMSMIGVARELGAHYGVTVRTPEVTLEEPGRQSDVQVTVEDSEICPRFVAIPLDRVEVAPSPLWMQLRLQAAGVRPINNVVDVTNYVMLELGQPLHAFDLAKVDGRSLTVRMASLGDRLQTLDGIDREVSSDDIVIYDEKGPASLAGVMGGESSEVVSVTESVLVEAANWDPPTIQETSIRHGLRSEASARFARGVDPNLPLLAAMRAAQLIVQLAHGKASGDIIDVYPKPVEPWEVEVPSGEVRRLLGVEIDPARVMQILERLGIEVISQAPFRVRVPTRRRDVTRPADIVEEVARLYGYNELPESLPVGTGGGLTTTQARTRLLTQVLVGAGFSEAQTFSFVGSDDLDRLGFPSGDIRSEAIALKNPISEDEGVLRTSLLPGLLRAASRNRTYGLSDVALFEIGRVFRVPPSSMDERIPSQPMMLSFVIWGRSGPRGLLASPRPADAYTATGTWRLVATALGISDAELRAADVPALHPARGAEVLVEGESIGWIGELHPTVTRAFELTGRIAVGEIQLDPLVAGPSQWTFEEPSTYPPVRFDLAFEVDESTPARTLVDTVQAAAGDLAENVHVFDEFAGESLEAGRKSLAVRVVLRAADRTLTEEEVGTIRRQIATNTESELDARLRGEL